jgi:histidyl-tRNA synthetase
LRYAHRIPQHQFDETDGNDLFEGAREDSSRRLKTNPLRILDSKNKDLQPLIEAAPKLMAHLDEESAKHFDAFKTYLECMDIPYVINTRLVRGLDYYNRTVFEWTSSISIACCLP